MKTGKRNSTGENRGNGERNLCFLCSLLLNSGHGDEADFTFLARDTCLRRERKRYGKQAASPYIDTACLPSRTLAAEGANTNASTS